MTSALARGSVIWALAGFLAACTSLVAPYDATFDQSLNKLSEDTAKFLAAASAGGSERRASSQESITFYAASFNLMDRLIQRARLVRSKAPCPTNALLKEIFDEKISSTNIPLDYKELDCHEMNLYAVLLNIDQLKFFHGTNGILSSDEADVAGLALQKSIMGAIIAFQVEKPS